MAMKYVKWKCISVFKFTFSHSYVQHLVQNENENSIISFKFDIFYTSFNMQIKNIFKSFISCKFKMKMNYPFNMSKQKL